MKKLTLILLLDTMITGVVLANCSIDFYRTIIYTGPKSDLKIKDLIQNSRCPEEKIKKVYKMILGSSGPLKRKYLKAFDPSINFNPPHFKIEKLQDFLKNNLLLSFGLDIQNSRIQGPRRTISLKPGDRIKVEGNPGPGKKIFTIKVSDKSGGKKSYWIECLMVKEFQVLLTNRDILSPRNSLGQHSFKMVRKKIHKA